MTGGRVHQVVAFGDLLLRLNPPGVERLVQASAFEVRYTGAEANLAAMLASLGVHARAVSKVPENEIGDACVNSLRRYGIDTRGIARGGDRLGLFYLETGASQRPSKVIYDRSGSSFTELRPGDVDWAAALDAADWLHFSGTAPAAGEQVVAVLREGLEVARANGARVSCDLNYRARLWSPADAGRVMSELMPYVDVLIGNEEDALTVFEIEAPDVDVTKGRLDVASYRGVAEQLVERFGLSFVATTLRRSISASANDWSGILFDGGEHYLSPVYEIQPIVDRVGGGDAFAAGIVYGLLEGWDPQRCVDFAAAASCLKHSIVGDFNLVTRAEIEALAAGDSSGRIQR
jgi:2-dehydro-3-deoxygluconokinase